MIFASFACALAGAVLCGMALFPLNASAAPGIRLKTFVIGIVAYWLSAFFFSARKR